MAVASSHSAVSFRPPTLPPVLPSSLAGPAPEVGLASGSPPTKAARPPLGDMRGAGRRCAAVAAAAAASRCSSRDCSSLSIMLARASLVKGVAPPRWSGRLLWGRGRGGSGEAGSEPDVDGLNMCAALSPHCCFCMGMQQESYRDSPLNKPHPPSQMLPRWPRSALRRRSSAATSAGESAV